MAWYSGNSGHQTHPVGTKKPNELGIYDMSGNVYEWCADWYGNYSSPSSSNPTGSTSGSSRLGRGGCCRAGAKFCRISYRCHGNLEHGIPLMGIRLVLRNFSISRLKPSQAPQNRHHYTAQIIRISPLSRRVNNVFFLPPRTSGQLTFTVNGITFEMIPVEGDTFTMGATAEQGDDVRDDEKPAHQVTLSDFAIGKHEVTQALWSAVMDHKPRRIKGDDHPAEYISWEDCQDFIRKLNALTGKNFCLPTEAEWEFAARGGTRSKGYKYSGSDNLDEVAWYSGNSGHQTHPVGTKKPNELGIYDMSGNVYEWCADWYGNYSSPSSSNPTGSTSGSSRLGRGGCCRAGAKFCRISYRCHGNLEHGVPLMGIRLVLHNFRI